MRGKSPASALFAERKEILVYSNVVVQLRMKGRNELIALPGGDDMSADNGQSLSTAIHILYIGCTYERHGDLPHSIELSRCCKTSELSAVSVASDIDIHCRYSVEVLTFHLLCQQYQSGTRAEDRQSVLNGLAYRPKKFQVLEQL